MALNGRTQCTDKSSKAELAWHTQKKCPDGPSHGRRARNGFYHVFRDPLFEEFDSTFTHDRALPRRVRFLPAVKLFLLRAEECVIAAKEEGIAKEDIEEEVGDLVDYMSAAIEKAVNCRC